jgi:hypothetical protein
MVLRYQLNILQQRTPCRLHLRWADRALFIWLYRRFPCILDAITIIRLMAVAKRESAREPPPKTVAA